MKTVSDELLDELMDYMREAEEGEILPRFRSVTSAPRRWPTIS